VDLVGFDVAFHALSGEKEHGVDAGVHAAGDVGVDAVAHQDGFFFGKAGVLHGQQGHLRLRLSDDGGTPSGGPEEHLAHAAAVRHIAVPGGADPVGVGGDEVHAPV